MSKGEAFHTSTEKHQDEAIFEGGPLHGKVRAIESPDTLIDAQRLIGNLETLEVSVQSAQYLRAQKPEAEGPNVTRWKYRYAPPKGSEDA